MDNNLELWILRLGASVLLILEIAYIIKCQLRRLFEKPNLESKGDNLEQLDD